MKRWTDRPVEIRNLLNPAFCALVQARAIRAFQKECDEGMAFSLALLVLPLCLTAETRTQLCERERSYFLKFVEESPSLVVGFAQRAEALLPFSLEGLGLLYELGCLDVRPSGALAIRKGKISAQFDGSDETAACERAATIVGRQFGRIRDRVTIYTALRIRP